MSVVRICPVCNQERLKAEMVWTKDCRGIPHRYVCYGCYDSVMKKGYDGDKK